MDSKVIIGDCREVLKNYPDESIDCIVTDPPYGISFMQKSWDKALPSLEALKECNRVLKSGAFGFFMCAPRMDVLWRMGQRLEEAGFRVDFSFMAHAYASGFPKSMSISKALDKRAGVKGDVIGISNKGCGASSQKLYNHCKGDTGIGMLDGHGKHFEIVAPTTDKAKEFSGAYTASLKPAVEVIICVMKPLSTKSYTDQVLENGKGCLWLDSCRIPYESEDDNARVGNKEPSETSTYGWAGTASIYKSGERNNEGRFPANLLCSDNILDDGKEHKRGALKPEYNLGKSENGDIPRAVYGKYKRISETRPPDSGSFSRYFSLDAWFDKKITELPEHIQKTFPFLITPKPSKSEKNKYIENKHPTVKPLKLMSYLITLGSREGDVILDPFAGSGTTLEACKLLNRVFIGIDKDPENEKYMVARGQLNTSTISDFTEGVKHDI